jgi:hypothetical protein
MLISASLAALAQAFALLALLLRNNSHIEGVDALAATPSSFLLTFGRNYGSSLTTK